MDNANGKKSLMNSIERLESTKKKALDLYNLSGLLLEKFTRKKDQADNVEKTQLEPMMDTRDLIDIFNDLDKTISSLLEQIGSNMNQTLNMIE